LNIIDRKYDAAAGLAADSVLARKLQYHSLADRENGAGEIARTLICRPLSHARFGSKNLCQEARREAHFIRSFVFACADWGFAVDRITLTRLFSAAAPGAITAHDRLQHVRYQRCGFDAFVEPAVF
jgi:hypothetical protein